jgi:hypothetical protein
MSSRGDLFRREAVEFHTRGETSTGSVIRLGGRWLRWSARVLLLLLAVGIAACILLWTDESSSGPAVVDARSGSFSALLPAAVAQDLRSARRFKITLSHGRSVTARVMAARIVPARAARAGLPPTTQPSVFLSGRIAGQSGVSGRVRGRATVVLRSERLGEVVLRQFGGMLGRSGAGG